LGIEPEEIRFDYLGIDTLHGRTAPSHQGVADLGDPRTEQRRVDVGRASTPSPAFEANEIGLRMAAKCRTREEADLVRREATHLWTIGGVGTAFGVPFRPRPVIALWPALIPRDAVKTEVRLHTV
jgi:hypothetical protein